MKLRTISKFLLAKSRGNAEQLPQSPIDWITQPLGRFFKIEAAAGLILLLFTLLALYLANSGFSSEFAALWKIPIGISIGSISFERSLHAWINDAVMTLFFFLIALELKRELVLGELRKPRLALLSISAAIGGMIVPASIYLLFQFGEVGQRGWGTVMATDTAFVIGCLALLGTRIPKSLRIFMLSLAIVDDLGAIIVVALGYGNNLDWLFIGCAFIGFALIKCMSSLGIRSLALFFAVGCVIWLFIDAAGIHPTVTGVVLGLMTPTSKWVNESKLYDIVNALWSPIATEQKNQHAFRSRLLKTAEAAAREALSPVERLEILLHPWVGFVVMPLFAFANAGIPLSNQDMPTSIILAIFFGFVLGKPAGICLFSWFAIKTKLAERPADLSWGLILAGGILAGIGFTMAIFIANLAFAPALINAAKLGILAASLFSSVIGIALLFFITRHHTASKLKE
ncbi:Na+/H+ antiporter NhaA [Salinimonas sp. HHU 13199]|uniref:Na(+)/H(+) antiporter NhaA n=1 Tax=Salinimonas profundi TaxID=2729140 RepID=A0ABR8LHY4_9ALTE|nr:Na+/H+ antiporter NhaA [Salinimonas profundi]MBD3584910.1 Na+/H+ antiporter NhaA [Salinimonas profundi]